MIQNKKAYKVKIAFYEDGKLKRNHWWHLNELPLSDVCALIAGQLKENNINLYRFSVTEDSQYFGKV